MQQKQQWRQCEMYDMISGSHQHLGESAALALVIVRARLGAPQ